MVLAVHLLDAGNAALVVIDHQPSQFAAVRSMDPDLLLSRVERHSHQCSPISIATKRRQWTASDTAMVTIRRRLGHRRELHDRPSPLLLEDGERKIMIALLADLDTFAKIDGSWYFAERKLLLDWSEKTRPSTPGTTKLIPDEAICRPRYETPSRRNEPVNALRGAHDRTLAVATGRLSPRSARSARRLPVSCCTESAM